MWIEQFIQVGKKTLIVTTKYNANHTTTQLEKLNLVGAPFLFYGFLATAGLDSPRLKLILPNIFLI